LREIRALAVLISNTLTNISYHNSGSVRYQQSGSKKPFYLVMPRLLRSLTIYISETDKLTLQDDIPQST
jgi:hypothetical protein